MSDTRAADLPIGVQRDSAVSIKVEFFDAAGAAVTLTGATVACDVIRGGAVVQAITTAIGGASNNEITCSLTDAQTGTGTIAEDENRWALDVTPSAAAKVPCLAGRFALSARGVAREPGTSAAAVERQLSNGWRLRTTITTG